MSEDIKSELKQEIQKIMDLLVQIDAYKEAVSDAKKAIKEEFGIPITTINKVVSILVKQNLEEEEAKWQEIRELIEICS
jgi:hypothetical protein